jgi:predicted hydrocarbon binding protein
MSIPHPLSQGGADAPLLADERPRVLHSQHYNSALVRSLLETDRVDARGIVENAAAELAFASLRDAERGPSHAAAVELFRESGLGSLDLTGLGPEGGEVVVSHSHFADGWVERYGKSRKPVCAVPAGFIAGALAAVHGTRFEVREVTCRARGDRECRFQAVSTELPPLPQPELVIGSPVSLALAPSIAPAIDEEAVLAAIVDAPRAVDRDGRIQALGGTLTYLWADFYSRVSYRFEREVPAVLGNKFTNLPSLVLTEAGHSYAFHTFGGILCSDRWRDRVAPLLSTREEWFHAIVALINAFGWGSWRVHALVARERATVRVYEGYEAAGYLRLFGPSTTPHCYMARGTVAALMNLLYIGDITQRPALTQSYYNQLFRSPLSFRAVETRCHASSDPYCEFIANPLSPNLSERMRELFNG